MKKVLFAFLWFVVLYFVACFLIGAVAGGIAGSHHPESVAAAQQAGMIAGARAVSEYRLLIVAGAMLLSAMGSVAGVLPGTRERTA
ncbi:MAG TPA: hypothetical protein VGY55_03155 [Pirellulales bacterium]|jgi:hypothetical protein|nr:hypothetical protein [Pirellulales bacterium]